MASSKVSRRRVAGEDQGGRCMILSIRAEQFGTWNVTLVGAEQAKGA